MAAEINIPSGLRLDLEIEQNLDDYGVEPVFPAFTFLTVFGDNVLTVEEKQTTQYLYSAVEYMPSNTNYEFRIYNTCLESDNSPIITITGTVNKEEYLTVPVTSAQLNTITNTNCKAELIFFLNDKDLNKTVNFQNIFEQVPPPDAPTLNTETVNTINPLIKSYAILREGDTISLNVDGVDYPPSINNGSTTYYFSVKNLVGGNTYTMTSTVKGADDQITIDTASLTVSTEDTSVVKILAPATQDFVSDGDTLTFTFENANPLQHSVLAVLSYTDDFSNDFISKKRVYPEDGTSGVLENVPTNGRGYKVQMLHIPELPGDPESEDWANVTEFLFNGLSLGKPSIKSPDNGSNISGAQTILFGVEGAAPGDTYNLEANTKFPHDPITEIQKYSGLTGSSQTITGLPNSGEIVYLTLETIIGNAASKDTIHVVSGSTNGVASPTTVSPAQLSDITTSGFTYTWNPRGTVPTEYWIHLGSFPGGKDLYDSDRLTDGSLTSHTIPTNAINTYNTGKIYLLLSYKVDGQWRDTITEYHVGTSSNENKAVISAPAPGTLVSGTSIGTSWVDSAFDADGFRIWVGSSVDAADYNTYDLPITAVSQEISGYSTDGEPIYVTLSSVKNGVGTIHSRRVYTFKTVIVQIGNHNLHQGVGIPTSTDGMEVIENFTDPIHLKGDNGTIIENKIFRPKDNGTGGMGGKGVLWLEDCTNCIIRNCAVICPPEWYRDIRYWWNKNPPSPHAHGKESDYANIGKAIYVTGGHSNRIENVNGYGGYDTTHIYRSPGMEIDNYIGRGHYRSGIISTNTTNQGSRKTHYRRIHTSTLINAIRSSGSADSIKFYNSIRPSNSAYDTILEDFYIAGGHSRTGSGCTIDGYDEKGPGGGITFLNGVCMDNGLKPFAIAHGGRNKLLNLWGYQELDGPMWEYNTNNGGGYVGDFIPTNGKGNDTDSGWGNHEVHGLRHRWRTSERKLKTFVFEQTKATKSFHAHSPGFTTQSDNKTDSNSTLIPCITRAEARSRALDLTKEIIVWDIPEAYTMEWDL